MIVLRFLTHNWHSRRMLHKALAGCVLAMFLAGLIPPPLIGRMAIELAAVPLPAAVTKPIAALAATAADLLPTVPAALAAPVLRPSARPLFQTGSSIFNAICPTHTVTNTAIQRGTTSLGGALGPITDTATVMIDPCFYDFGDLPDGSAGSTGLPTTSPAYNTDITGTVGAFHVITPGLYLGNLVDDENDGQPSATATGDDNAGTPDDEDGVTFPTFVLGQSAAIGVSVVNTTGTPAILYGFIDFNGDGTFDDANETITQTVSASGVVTLTFSVPFTADTAQSLGARFRLSTDTALGPNGAASDGEVEDYLITVEPKVSLGNRVWYDTDNDGSVTAGEQNVANGVVVELYQDSDSNGIFSTGDDRITSTVTSGGYYTFTNLTPSSSNATRYVVVISDTNFVAGGLLYGYQNSTGQITDNSSAADDNNDHGAVRGTLGQVGGVVASRAISLTTGTQPTGEGNEGNDPIQSNLDADSNQTIDFGFYQFVLGNRIWVDVNNNGLDDSEAALGATLVVTATNQSTGAVYTTTTNANGYYTFTGIVSGTYVVSFQAPAGYISSSTDGDPNAADLDDNGVGSSGGMISSAPFTLTPGASIPGVQSVSNATGVTANPSVDFGIWQPQPVIDVIKYTNGADADLATGPILAVGETVTWTYAITNTGNVTLTGITLNDDVEGNVLCPAGQLAPGASMTCSLTGTATAGQYANTAVVTGTPTLGPVTPVTDSNPSHYFGGDPRLVLRKYTNGYDADDATGPYLAMGETVTWTYVITNTGNQLLTNLTLEDSVEGPVTCAVTSLAAGASTTCVVTGTASAGQYANTAVVSGTTPFGTVLTFTNPSHYYGVDPSLALIKYTNGADADTVPGPTIDEGQPVTWTYVVTNTGNVALTGINLVDDVEGAITCPATDLAVGATMTCTWTDVAQGGQYTNTAVVTGTPDLPTNPTPDLPGYPTQPTPTEPVTDTNPSHYFGQEYVLIGDYLWVEDDNNGAAADGFVRVVSGQVVTATNSTTGQVYTDTTDASGRYTITVPANATYTVTTGLAIGQVVDTVVRTADGSNPVGNNDLNHERMGTTVVVTTTDNLSIDFGFYEPPAALLLSKWLVSPTDGMAKVGETVIYDLVITNTGAITVNTISLADQYDGAYLQYSSASIAPTAQASGVLTWTLSSPTPPLPLSAGETMTVTVTFTATKP